MHAVEGILIRNYHASYKNENLILSKDALWSYHLGNPSEMRKCLTFKSN